MVRFILAFWKWQASVAIAIKRHTFRFWDKLNELWAILNRYLDTRDEPVEPTPEPSPDERGGWFRRRRKQ